MTTPLDQLDRWLRLPAENEHLEFKEAKRSFDFEKLLDYCVALANELGGKLILGVSNAPPRQVVGTAAYPDVQDVREKVFHSLRRRIEVEEVLHPDGRVLIFHVPSRPLGEALHRDGRYLMRIGETLVPMSFDQLQRITAEAEPDFSAGVVDGADLLAIDPEAVDRFRAIWAGRSGNHTIANLPTEQLLADAGLLLDGRITRAALILLGTSDALRRHLAQAEVIFEYRSSEGSLPYQQRVELRRGFFTWYDELVRLVELRNDRQMILSGLFRVEIPTFDEAVVREAVLNAVSHRDYRLSGSVFVRQFPRRLEIVSPGGLPVGITPENIIDRQLPRNRCIAEALARCRLVERSGQGMNRIYEGLIRQSKPRPDFTGTDAHQVSLALHGEVQNPEFLRFLKKVGVTYLETFTTHDFLILDHVQRGESLPESLRGRVPRLVEMGIIERSGRQLLLSRALYAHLGQRGTYTRRKGLDHDTNKELLLKHIRDNAAEGSPLTDLVQVLPHLGRRKVKALLQELRIEGRAVASKGRRFARWFPAPPFTDGQ